MKPQKTLNELDYNLELSRVASEIKKKKAKKVLIQLPDGLKPYATAIADELKKQTNSKAEIFIWLDSCFGACDIPQISKKEADLIVQFGHSEWNFKK